MKKHTLASYLVNFAAAAAIYILITALMNGGIISRQYQGVLVFACINCILAVSLNLTTGFLGEIALGHAGFMSIGAYTGALITKAEILPGTPGLLLGMLAGGLVAVIFALFIGLPVLRLKGDYLAIVTLGFGEIIRVIVEALPFTGGAKGLTGIPRLTNFTIAYWVMVAVIAILFAFIRSRHGRAIIAISQDDIASEAAGIPNTYYKTLAFTIAAFFAGVAGCLFANYMGILGAKTFNFLKSIDILVIVVLGGMGSFTGSIVAAFGLTLLPELLRGFDQYRMLVYSIALILMMMFRPSGLMGGYEFSLTRLFYKLKPKRKEATK
jgi:branched-chain amino acid transport system permease protein